MQKSRLKLRILARFANYLQQFLAIIANTYQADLQTPQRFSNKEMIINAIKLHPLIHFKKINAKSSLFIQKMRNFAADDYIYGWFGRNSLLKPGIFSNIQSQAEPR